MNESRNPDQPPESTSMIPSSAETSAPPRMLFNPPIDIYETSDGLVLYADLPGVDSEGLDLQVQDNRLTLFGRVASAVPQSAEMLHQEYQDGDFLRSFILSDEVDHDRIQAKLINGVLRRRTSPCPPRNLDALRFLADSCFDAGTLRRTRELFFKRAEMMWPDS